MSRPTAPAKPGGEAAPAWALGLAIVLGMAYSPLAHWARASACPWLAVLAFILLVLMLFIEPMARLQWWAWLVCPGALIALVPLWNSPHALLLLAAPPVLFTAWIAGFFARSLRAGRIALITRIVCALYAQAGQALSAAQLRYTRRLTWAWALLLTGLALFNAVLGVCAVPGGLLAQLGRVSPWPVSDASASLFANLLAWAVVGGFAVAEYWLRLRWFPHRPYRNPVDFVVRLVRLGPTFWRQVLR